MAVFCREPERGRERDEDLSLSVFSSRRKSSSVKERRKFFQPLRSLLSPTLSFVLILFQAEGLLAVSSSLLFHSSSASSFSGQEKSCRRRTCSGG